MLSKIAAILLRLGHGFEREAGQALAEYGLILALIVAASVMALTALGLTMAAEFDAINAVLP